MFFQSEQSFIIDWRNNDKSFKHFSLLKKSRKSWKYKNVLKFWSPGYTESDIAILSEGQIFYFVNAVWNEMGPRRYHGTEKGGEGWSQRCTLYYCQPRGQSPPSIQHHGTICLPFFNLEINTAIYVKCLILFNSKTPE